MNFEFLDTAIWEIAKWFVVFGMGIYLVFALVIVKQVSVMLNVIAIGFEKPIKFFAYLHLLFAIGVLILSIVIL